MVASYCLEPEDSMMDTRLTRIQQRYLLSERASNCSSSNTPEVKLEQRRRRRLRRRETEAKGGGGGRGGGGGGGEKEEMKGEGGGGGRERGRGGGGRGRERGRGGRGGREGVRGREGRGRGRGRVGRRLVVDGGVSGMTEEVERLVLTVKEEREGRGGGGRGGGGGGSGGGSGGKRERGAEEPKTDDGGAIQEESEEILIRPTEDATTPSRSQTPLAGIRLHRSPVVKLHRVETPPSTSLPTNLFGRLQSRDSSASRAGEQQPASLTQEEEQGQTNPASPVKDKSLLKLEAAGGGDTPGDREGGSTGGPCVSLHGQSPRSKIELSLKKRESVTGTSSGAAVVEQMSSEQVPPSTSGVMSCQSGQLEVAETNTQLAVADSGEQLLEVAESGGQQLAVAEGGGGGGGQVSGGLRRSPRKNKWISGQKPSSSSGLQSASDTKKANKKVTTIN